MLLLYRRALLTGRVSRGNWQRLPAGFGVQGLTTALYRCCTLSKVAQATLRDAGWQTCRQASPAQGSRFKHTSEIATLQRLSALALPSFAYRAPERWRR